MNFNEIQRLPKDGSMMSPLFMAPLLTAPLLPRQTFTLICSDSDGFRWIPLDLISLTVSPGNCVQTCRYTYCNSLGIVPRAR